MDTSVGFTPLKLSTDKRLLDAPPSLEPPHADKNTEIESTLAEKIVRVISSYPFLNQLNYVRALAYLCQSLITYWFITWPFNPCLRNNSKTVFHFCKNTQTRRSQSDQTSNGKTPQWSCSTQKKTTRQTLVVGFINVR